MKKAITYCAGALVLLFVFTHFFTGEGEKEFKRTQKAVKAVSSWRVRSQVSVNGRLMLDRIHEAKCPDQEHIAENSGQGSSEYTRIGDSMYWRRAPQMWSESKSPDDLFQPMATPRPCMTNPAQFANEKNGIDEMQEYLQQVIDQGSFAKGDLQMVGNDQCRDWTVMAMNERRQLVSTTFCISEVDHLPRRMQSVGEVLTITYDWNLPIVVEKPDLNPPPSVSVPVQGAETGS
jgi:hypothetical protein